MSISIPKLFRGFREDVKLRWTAAARDGVYSDRWSDILGGFPRDLVVNEMESIVITPASWPTGEDFVFVDSYQVLLTQCRMFAVDARKVNNVRLNTLEVLSRNITQLGDEYFFVLSFLSHQGELFPDEFSGSQSIRSIATSTLELIVSKWHYLQNEGQFKPDILRASAFSYWSINVIRLLRIIGIPGRQIRSLQEMTSQQLFEISVKALEEE